MQDEGKIRHIGLSEVKPAEIDKARKTIRVVSVQNLYNIGDRDHEDTLQYCEKNQARFYSLVSGGRRQTGAARRCAGRDRRMHHATVAQLALAWLLHHSKVMLPIPGTSSVAHLEENVGAAELKLDADEWSALEHKVEKVRA